MSNRKIGASINNTQRIKQATHLQTCTLPLLLAYPLCVHTPMTCCRRSDALRLSLSDAFAGQAGSQQHNNSDQQHNSNKPRLTEEACNALLEQCLKLATENKITERNAWQLNLITHLPDIVGGPARGGSGSRGGGRGGAGAVSSSAAAGFNFQKMSGGLDAGRGGVGR